jgi:DNA-binding MarR family transcriptional regulator
MSATPPAATTAVVPLSPAEESVARAMGRLMQVLGRALDADLVREQRMSLSEYTVLRVLSEDPDRRMRMNELATACNMSLSGMTRLADRLESGGFLLRVRCEHDARGAEAVLTDGGLVRLEQAWPTHLASMRRHVFDHLDGLDPCTLAQALNAMAADC